jgi:hypothetical protein
MIELDMCLYAYKYVHSTVKMVGKERCCGELPTFTSEKKEKIGEKRGQKSIIKPGIQVS